MPLLVTYAGRTVKRRTRLGNYLKIAFYPSPGCAVGERFLVTQAEWQEHGFEVYIPRNQEIAPELLIGATLPHIGERS